MVAHTTISLTKPDDVRDVAREHGAADRRRRSTAHLKLALRHRGRRAASGHEGDAQPHGSMCQLALWWRSAPLFPNVVAVDAGPIEMTFDEIERLIGPGPALASKHSRTVEQRAA